MPRQSVALKLQITFQRNFFPLGIGGSNQSFPVAFREPSKQFLFNGAPEVYSNLLHNMG